MKNYSLKKASGTFLVVLTAILSALVIISGRPANAADSVLENLKEHPASLKTKNIKVTTLLQAIGRQGGINIYVNDKITDTIDIEMDNLTLYDIFQVVIKAKHLHFTETNDIVFVERESDYQKENNDTVTSKLCTIFGNTGEHIDKLEPFLDQNGSLTVANRGNCLIVRSKAENIDRIKEILKELDQPVPQVHIEAKILTISQEAKKQLGIKWGYDNLSTRNTLAGNSDLSISGSSSLAIGFLRDNLNLSIDLQALQQDGKLQILSAPRILVTDGQKATIKQGKEVPYVSQSGDTVNTSFREANLSLQVTPKVLRENYIALDVEVTNDSVDQTTLVGSEPLINKQSITTNLFLENDVTVVIGGILLQTDDSEAGNVPVFSSIPLLGNLFKSSSTNKEQSELLVFITPKIVHMRPMYPEKATPGLAITDSDTPQKSQADETADDLHGSQR